MLDHTKDYETCSSVFAFLVLLSAISTLCASQQAYSASLLLLNCIYYSRTQDILQVV